MNKLQRCYFNDPMLSLTIGELSSKASVLLTASLAHIATFRLAVSQMHRTGPSEEMRELAQREIDAVQSTERWLRKEQPYLLDFVLDLQDVVNRLFKTIWREFKALR